MNSTKLKALAPDFWNWYPTSPACDTATVAVMVFSCVLLCRILFLPIGENFLVVKDESLIAVSSIQTTCLRCSRFLVTIVKARNSLLVEMELQLMG